MFPSWQTVILVYAHVAHRDRLMPSPLPHHGSEVKKRVRQNPGLINAIGGDIESFSDVEMSTVGTAGGSFGLAGGGGGKREGPSRVIKARLRFVGRRAGAGGAGWAEVEVSDWERERGDNGMEGLEYDRVNGERTDEVPWVHCITNPSLMHGTATLATLSSRRIFERFHWAPL